MKMQNGNYKQPIEQYKNNKGLGELPQSSTTFKGKQLIQSIYPFNYNFSEVFLSDTKPCTSVGKSEMSEGTNNMSATYHDDAEYDISS